MTEHTTQTKADGAVYKSLLESTKAIPWKIDWSSMTFAYIGPQIEELLGWTPSSWASAEDWIARMHPDEREDVANYCVAQSKAGIDHEADYRALTKDGGYVWIRDVVHVIRGADGEVESLVGFMIDISERKALEQELAHSNDELKRTNDELKAALKKIKTISGIIPICAGCGGKIKDENDEWVRVDEFIRKKSDAEISHGMCPSCAKDYMADVLSKT